MSLVAMRIVKDKILKVFWAKANSNWVASNLADGKELQAAIQNERLL